VLVSILPQHLAEEVQTKEADKDSLPLLFSELTSSLPSENSDCESLQSTLDSLNTGWANLTQQMGQQQTCLEMALGLANVTEGAVGKLIPWVPDTLQHLKSLGPPPAEPEQVEQQKAELEVSGSFSLRDSLQVYAWVCNTCEE